MTVDELLDKWWGRKGGAERSNFATFVHDLCDALDLPRPGVAEAGKLGEYEFEGSVPGGSFRSLKASGSIDLYKRGCFIMEAKQSLLNEAQKATPDLFDPAETAPQAPSGARYDRLMQDARAQAENYAKNLPGDHPPAPFIIVCDVGRAFEIEFDYTHLEWVLRIGGWLGVGNDNRYNNSQVFDPFPFPDPTPEQHDTIADLAEELDATRKTALAEVPGLTMTDLYNLRDKLRSGTALTPAEEERATQARAGIVNRLHEQIDAAVAAAYGWPADLAPVEIVARLVALNAERAAEEEKEGKVRWLRPDYQVPRFEAKKPKK